MHNGTHVKLALRETIKKLEYVRPHGPFSKLWKSLNWIQLLHYVSGNHIMSQPGSDSRILQLFASIQLWSCQYVIPIILSPPNPSLTSVFMLSMEFPVQNCIVFYFSLAVFFISHIIQVHVYIFPCILFLETKVFFHSPK